MLLEFLVEEPSAEAALYELIPKILREQDGLYDFEVRTFNGKTTLLDKLPQRLRGYRHNWYDELRLIILIDKDDDDCHMLKAKLEHIAADAGLITRSQARSTSEFHVINRIIIEELEAWFFGDVEAIRAAYSGIDPFLAAQTPYRDPDAIRGGTWEALERVLVRHHPGGLEKVRAASEIARHMQPERNQSRSFQTFRHALLDLFEL